MLGKTDKYGLWTANTGYRWLDNIIAMLIVAALISIPIISIIVVELNK